MADFDPSRLIVKIAACQDRAAFAALFDHYAPRIKTFMMRRGAASGAAEDMAQETLLTLWRKASQFDPARASASAWVFAIARNLGIDSSRREHRAQLYVEEERSPPEAPEQPDAALMLRERETRVRDALNLLPGDQLRVVELSFFEGRAHADIAALLEIPLGTVKSRLRLAFRRLREHLGDLT